MEMTLVQRLQMYIDAEMADSALYKELSKIAPNDEYEELLLEFSADERKHADEFKRIYRMLTCSNYNPMVPRPVLEGSFREILRDRVLDESGDFRKYGLEYIKACNPVLEKAFYIARTDENVHALRLLYMLSE